MRLLPLTLALAWSVPAAAELPPPPVPVRVSAVPLYPGEPERDRVGALRYLGGIEIEAEDERVGGFSSLKWHRGFLYGVTDEGNWAMMRPLERDGRLTGLILDYLEPLHAPGGEALQGTATGDAEALARSGGDWLVGFEHQHKILRYSGRWRPKRSGLSPQALFPGLADNNGIEALAARKGRLFVCAERLPGEASPNCLIVRRGRSEPLPITPPPGPLDPRTAFPVDADWARDGTLYILVRSWSGGNDNRVAVLARSPGGETKVLATFVPPLTTDNYEGLALREEQGRTIYLISDDNFKKYNRPGEEAAWQRTLLLKFERVG